MVFTRIQATTAWAKIKDIRLSCFIGNDTFAIGCGSVLQFTTMSTGNDCYYRPDCKKNGDGINCLAGHKNLMLFAFAELVPKANIYVLHYPSFRHISVLKNPAVSNYKQIGFSQTELIVALTGMPDFLMQVFSWRSNSLLVSNPTNLLSDIQLIRFNLLGSCIGQLATFGTKLYIWEVHGTINECKLLKRRIELPEDTSMAPFAFSFYTDGSIMLMNCYADVYNINVTTHHAIKIIHNPERNKGDHPFIHIFKGGLIISASDFAIKYYKKVNNVWTMIAYYKINEKILILKLHKSEAIIGVTQKGEILKFVLNNDTFDCSLVRMYSRTFKNIIILNPVREYLVTLTIYDVISIFYKHSGKKIETMKIPNTTLMREHPIYPYFLVGDKLGSVHVISGYQPKNLKVIAVLRLCHDEIFNIEFSKKGGVFAVNDIKGNLFIISAKIGTEMEILKHIHINQRFFDFVINETDTNLYIFALQQTSDYNEIPCGDVLIRIILDKLMSYKIETVQLNGLYVQLNSYLDMINGLIAIPLCSIEIHVIEVVTNNKTNKPEIKIIDTIYTLHKLKYFHLRIEGTHALTYGMDGLITLIDLVSRKNVYYFLAHHRLTLGVVEAEADLFLEFIISLGNSGNIICSKMPNAAIDTVLLRANRVLLKSAAVENMFTKETIGFEPADANKSWTDIQEEEKLKKEQKQFAILRKAIINDFQKLKAQLDILINQNENAPENEKLPLQAFNLDKDLVDSIKEIARKDRESEDKTMRHYCKVQGDIVKWLMTNYWDKMEIPGTKIRGMFVRLCTENYALLKRDENWEKKLKSVALWRSTENIVATNDKFQPWLPMEIRELEEILSREPKIVEHGALEPHDSFYSNEYEVDGDGEDSEEKKRKKLETLKYSLSGTNTHKYIEPYIWRYGQMEVVTYSQMNMEIIMGLADTLGLCEYFNKQFLKLQEDKVLEMHMTRQRNDRLRYIQKELNILSKLKNSEEFLDDVILDPEYMPDEKPESIVVVEEWEVPITPYISPSRQKILDEMAAEMERRRLEMLADDFRERALMAMMDGVLEVRWEDEIKKNPPLPECLTSEKDPKDYDEADLKIIAQYEQKMKFLNSERDRYRLMLEQEQVKLSHTLDDQIMKFNYKVGELLLSKIKIEFAINCEKMKLLKNSYYNIRRINNSKIELGLKEEIQQLEKDDETLSADLRELEEKSIESLNAYEAAVARDRMLDKQFKLSFSEHASPTITDLAYKIFRRRAKWQMRSWATPSILLDMANRVITNKKSVDDKPVPDECIAYLELLEKNDNYALAPNTMDQNLWEILCKMRRIKIESEFKVRYYGGQHAEIEAAANFYTKEVSQNKQQLQILQQKLDDLRNKNLENTLNRYIQIVMKRGLVEIPITGRLTDFNDALLIHVTDVGDINKIIKKAGKKKIIAMQNAAVFRRKIIYKEWEHLVLRMTVRDMKDTVSIIEKFQITKEVQLWLKRKKKGWHDDFSQTAINRDIAAMINCYEKILDEVIEKTNELEKKIELKKKENRILDKKIQAINIDLTELNFGRDLTMEEREMRGRCERMTILVERSKLVRLVQQQHSQILELSTILELQKLRTFPTLNVNCDYY